MAVAADIPARPSGEDPAGQFLCLTICGYRRPGMSEEDYRYHMTRVSAPMTKDLMVKYGMKRWTMVGLGGGSFPFPFLFLSLFFFFPRTRFFVSPTHKRESESRKREITG